MSKRQTLHLKLKRLPAPSDDSLAELLDQSAAVGDKSVPTPKPHKGYFSEHGFSAAPLARSAAVATDTEWEAAARQNASRMVIEGMKAIQQDPAQLEKLAKSPEMLELAIAVSVFIGANKPA
jgi:hypothetical protein